MAINFLNTVAVDDNVLFVDTVNDRVGIGTGSPSYKLTAYGNSADSEIVASFGSVNDQNEYTAIGLSGFIASNGATKAGLALKRTGTFGTGELHFLNNNTLDNSDMTLSDSKMMIDASGNVGIGTTAPNGKLDVTGNIWLNSDNANAAYYLRINRGQSQDGGILLYGNGVLDWQLVNLANRDLNWYSYGVGSSVMRLTSAGNLGIGTTSPNAKLQINNGGSGNIASFASGATSINNYAGITLHTQTNSGDDWYGSEIRSINTAGTPGSLNPRLGFFTQDNNTYLPANRTEKMSIIGNGNVGIGTTSPAAGLQVARGGATIPLAGSSTASAVFGNSTSDDNYGVAIGANSSGVGYISSQRTDGTATTYNLAIQPNGGNVGIGTTSPSSELHVEASDNPNLLITRGGVNKVLLGDSGSNNGGDLLLYNADGTLTTLIRSGSSSYLNGGNVGIGTTSPDVKLEVIDASPTNGIIADFVNSTNAGGTTAAIKLSNADSEACDVVLGANRVGANFGSDFFISLSDSVDGSNQERFRITEAGNVGIGTTTPGSKLEVNGDIDTTGSNGYLINGKAWALENSSILTLGDWDGNDFPTRIMDENSNEVLRVTGGNVGIGTTSPNSKLQVDGGVQIADDTDVASADKVGTFKYRVSGNNSYVDMCMQTGATSYAWVNIVQNNW